MYICNESEAFPKGSERNTRTTRYELCETLIVQQKERKGIRERYV